MLTIPTGIKDPSYRYKMPKMVLAQESRLNGVKTNITNLDDVAEHLRVPPLAMMKFFCAELGANMEKESLIKGKHPYDVMLKHLDKFIKMYVICANCKYPELKMKVEGKDNLLSSCNSCGTMNKHDSTHKAGKVFVLEFKKKGERETDIIKKDKAAAAEDVDDFDDDKPKKDKKKKKAKDKDDDEEEKEEKPDEPEVSDNDDELTIGSRRILKVTDDLHKLSEKDLNDNAVIISLLEDAKALHGISNDFAFYVSLVGLFPPKRNILKNWAQN